MKQVQVLFSDLGKVALTPLLLSRMRERRRSISVVALWAVGSDSNRASQPARSRHKRNLCGTAPITDAVPRLLRSTTYRARALRCSATAAERKLWGALRNRQLGAKFRRQQVFGSMIVDFCCIEAALIIEVDGPYHLRAAQPRYDRKRDTLAQLAGWTVLHFSNHQVLHNLHTVLLHIRHALQHAPQLPSYR
jgi:very-short-patch-repair endonuclease